MVVASDLIEVVRVVDMTVMIVVEVRVDVRDRVGLRMEFSLRAVCC